MTDKGQEIVEKIQQQMLDTLHHEYAKVYRDFNEYLKMHPIGEINLQQWLNKQEYTKHLPSDSLSSWNRYPLYPMLTHTKEISEGKEMLNKKVNDFFGYVKGNILKNRDHTMKLAQEMKLQAGLEKVYFGKLKEGSIVRVDYGYPTLFEFDDFPRGIFYASILEEYEKVKNGCEDVMPSFVRHIQHLIEPGTTFVFVLHETASHANVQEHIYMAKLLEHYGVNAVCISNKQREEGEVLV